MKRYPKYKASGVEWIGEIPVHWAMKRLKYLASLISKGTTPTTIGREILDQGEIRFIKGENIVDNQIELKPEYYIDEETNQMLKRSQLKEDDLLFVIAGTIGKVGFVRTNHLPANTNQAISFIRLHKKELPEFIYYWLQSDNIQKITWLEVVQSAQPNLSMENLGNLYIPYPNIAEQAQIANFLNRKAGQIDELIRSKERRIELLQEQRTALINQGVTKGLDPNVEMKPSEVEWIGEIPVHWEVVRNKFIFQQIRDISYPNLPLLSIGIKGIIPKSQTDQKDVSSVDKSLYKRVKIGDIAFNVMTVWKGGIGMSDYEGIVSPAYQVCRSVTKLVPKYFHYLFRTDLYKAIFDMASYQVVDQRHNLYYEHFKNISAICPSFSEQAQIANFLDHKTQQIDELVATEHRKIELLKEYRQSLISEVVTGKIDVRNEV